MVADGPDTRRADAGRSDAARRNNPMNRLVPYLDLFARLDDGELSRLAGVEIELVATLRRQVVEIGQGLATYLDLLPRLSDEELVRLTGASAKTVRFWRLCQPRASARAGDMQAGAEISSITPMPRPVTPAPTAAPAPTPPRDEQPTALRRRTTGVGMQPTMLPTAAPAQRTAPVANWSSEASATSAATTITPPPHPVPVVASWDAESGTATMVTPIDQTPAAMWGNPEVPSDTETLAAASAPRPEPQRRVDPSESQPAGRALDINGDPFPGFEKWRPGDAPPVPDDDDPEFALADFDH